MKFKSKYVTFEAWKLIEGKISVSLKEIYIDHVSCVHYISLNIIFTTIDERKRKREYVLILSEDFKYVRELVIGKRLGRELEALRFKRNFT